MKFNTFFDLYSMENYIKPPKLYQKNILKSKIYWSAKGKEFHSCRKVEKNIIWSLFYWQLFWLHSIFYFGKSRRCRTRKYIGRYFVATILTMLNLLFRRKSRQCRIRKYFDLYFLATIWTTILNILFQRFPESQIEVQMLAKNHCSWCEGKISTLPFTLNMHPYI